MGEIEPNSGASFWVRPSMIYVAVQSYCDDKQAFRAAWKSTLRRHFRLRSQSSAFSFCNFISTSSRM